MEPDLGNKRILFLAGTLGQGGAERQLYYILKCLKTTEWLPDPELITYTQGEFWEQPIRELGIPIHHAGQQNNRLKRLWKTIQITRQVNPDWLYSMHFYINTYAGVTGRITGVTSFGSVRSSGRSELRSAGTIFGRLHYFLPHIIVANSEHGLANIQLLLGERRVCQVLTNAIDTDYFEFNAKIEIHNQHSLLFVGRLEQVKRCDRFLKLIKDLLDAGQDIRGIVLGDGRLTPELKQLSENLGLLNVVQFVGKVNDVRPWYTQSTLLVSTSDFEGTPNVVLEAMACGLPVLCMRFEGIDSIIVDMQNGAIADNGNELHVQALEIIKKPDLQSQLAQNARAHIEKTYSLRTLDNRLYNIITLQEDL